MEHSYPLDCLFWEKIDRYERILISGCGGGYDIMQGLPLYFALRSQNKQVFLGNMSFSELGKADGEIILKENNPGESIVCMSITHKTSLNIRASYFPEKYLCEWFKEVCNEDVQIFAFKRRGPDKIAAAYSALIEKYGIQAIVLVDGGSDSLMAGDEAELGTPLEDMLSIFAVQSLNIPSFLVCLGIGADRFHGVSDCSSLRAIAELTQSGGFLGSLGLEKTMPEVIGFLEASQYVESKMQPSIVGFFVKSAIQGKFGNYNILERTRGQKLFVYPLMGWYFFFDLEKVYKRILYRQYCEGVKNATEFMVALDAFRVEIEQDELRPVEELPLTKDV